MGVIKIDTAQVSAEQVKLTSQVQRLEELMSQTTNTISGLDVQLSARPDLDAEVESLLSLCRRVVSSLKQLSKSLDTVVDSFTNADRKIKDLAQDVIYLMEQPLQDSGAAANSSTQGAILGSAAGALASGAFGISQEGYSTIRHAMDMLHSACNELANLEGKVSLEGQRIFDYVTANDPDLLFGSYSIYMNKFINKDLKWYDELAFAAREYDVFWDILTGSNVQDIVDRYLNDPDKCKVILRSVIDEMCGTTYLDALSSNQEMVLNKIGELAKEFGYDDVSELIGAVTTAAGSAEIADKILKDYSSNLLLLESLKGMSPSSGVLSDTVDALIKEYNHQAYSIIKDELESHAKGSAVEIFDSAFGTQFGAITKAIDATLGQSDRLNAIDTVIFSSSMNTQANANFREAAKVIASGNFTSDDLTNFKTSFDFCKSMNIMQYEAMLDYYKAGSKEAEFLRSEISKLESMTYDNYQFAGSIKYTQM